MQQLKVAAAALNQTPLDWQQNAANIIEAVRQAKSQHVGVLCLPELCITGYGCEDAFYSDGLAEMAMTVLSEVLPETNGIVVSVGLPFIYRGGLFNGAALLVDGRVIGIAAKQNLAGEGLHYEPRWFKAWPNDAQGSCEVDGVAIPIGDIVFDVGSVRIGFEICEDAWVLDRPGGELAQQGVDIILNPSASHFAFGKHEVRRRLVVDGSRSFFATYVYANLLGNEAGRAIYDGDTMIASVGELLAEGKRLTYQNVELITTVVDINAARMERRRSSSFPIHVESDLAKVVATDFEFPVAHPDPPNRPSEWEAGALKQEEFTRAIALGLFDYLRKSRSHGFVVSLSGGADSAAVSVLAATALKMAQDDLGSEGIADKLGYLPDIATENVNALTKRLLTCAYQSTRNSSETTLHAAEDVAQAINADFHVLDVDALVDGYTSLISDALDRELTWEMDDLALQNIQARARGPSVWMLANIRNSLLLATSNRSEAAVGYATMDGDTCGGLSPIAGIDKAFLREWLRWMEREGPMGCGPIPALAAVNCQQPTAELRPPETQQQDEKDLMPYEILDEVECLAIGDKLTPLECFCRMRESRSDLDAQQLANWIERFFTLWCRNQWKRERYAPSFHVDDKNLDPKTWCRFPILSGGYRRELSEMWKYVCRSDGS